MSALSDPLSVTTRDAGAWWKRAVDPEGHGLYARADCTDVCPELWTIRQLAVFGLTSMPASVGVERPGEFEATLRHACTTSHDMPETDVLRAEDAADITTLAPARSADATYNAAFGSIELELTATSEQWVAWQKALHVDLARTTNRGGCVTSHATWRGLHVVVRCWFVRPGTGGA